MSILEIIKTKNEFIPIIQTAIIDTFKSYAHATITAKPVSFETKKSKLKHTVGGVLRLTTPDNSKIALAIGFSDQIFAKIYENQLSEKSAPAERINQDLAGELINIIFQTIDPKLRTYEHHFCAAIPEIITGIRLEEWLKINSEVSLVLPFTTTAGEIYFEITEKIGDYMIDHTTRILLVDDSAAARVSLGRFFRELGYKNFEICNDGEEAMKWLATGKPPFGLVFSDWHMPNMTGLELLSNIRKSEDPKIKIIPVVLATAERKVEEIKKAISAGVSGYVVKPYTTDSIQKTLEKIKIPTQNS